MRHFVQLACPDCGGWFMVRRTEWFAWLMEGNPRMSCGCRGELPHTGVWVDERSEEAA